MIMGLSLLPYLRFGPIGVPTETQPWAALAAWAMLLIFLVRGRLNVTRFAAIIFAFSFLFMVYIPLGDDLDIGQYLRKSMAFVLSISVMIIARYLTPSLIIGVLKPVALLWLVFAVLGEINPSLYQDVISPLVPGALGSYGERGVTSLAPEATDFGFIMVYFWVLAMVASTSDRANGGQGAPLWLYGVILGCIILSRSGAGMFGLTVVLLVKAATYSSASRRSHLLPLQIVLLAITAPFVLFLVAHIVPETGVRGIDLLVAAVQSPLDLVHTTLSYRIAHNMVGFYGMLDSNLLGHGAGTFTVMGVDVYNKHYIGDILGVQGWFRINIPNTLSESALAIFPVILFEYGLLGLIFLLFLFGTVLTSTVRFRYVIFALLFMTWAQSFPVAFPLFWLLLGLVQNKKFMVPNTLNPRHAVVTSRSARQAL